MTDERRTSPEQSTGGKPDELIALYREGVADDAGPSAPSRERVLAYARAQAAKRAAASPSLVTGSGESTPTTTPREAANDRRWLRHALGTFAMVGLVGWLTMQHLDQPGAPRLESSSSPAIQSAPMDKKEAAPEPDANSNRGSTMPADAAVEDSSASPRVEQAPAKPAERTAPMRESAPTSRPAPYLPAPPSAPAPVATPTPAPSPAPTMSTDEPRAEAVEGLSRQRGTSAEMRSSAPTAAKEKSVINEAAAIKPLPECEASMDAQAQAEQARRIKQRDEAQVAGKPWRGPAPTCRPQAASEPEQADGSSR